MFIIDRLPIDTQVALKRPIHSTLERPVEFMDEKGREWNGMVTPFTRALFRDYWVYLEYKRRVYICIFEMVSLGGITVGLRYRVVGLKECQNLEGGVACISPMYELMEARDIPEVLFTELCNVIGERNS